MREFYEAYKPNKDTIVLLQKIDRIIEEYQAQGFTLTLRQLYYQLVSRDIVPNTDRSYKNVGSVVAKARMGGLLDWDAIEDRVRTPKRASQWNDLAGLVESAVASYRLPRMEGQEQHVELWVEKDALAGVLWPIAHHNHITLMVNRGYSSASAMRESAERIRRACTEGEEIVPAIVLYLGDLDPSGEDMVRDIQERLDLFVNGGEYILCNPLRGEDYVGERTKERAYRKRHIDISVEKLALTEEQVDTYSPPPNPAKVTDPRATKYIEKFGDSSWEVDALPPTVLRDIIEERLAELIDEDKVNAVKDREDADKSKLRKAVKSGGRVPG